MVSVVILGALLWIGVALAAWALLYVGARGSERQSALWAEEFDCRG